MLQVLLDWINDELADLRIIVKDIEEDLFDGQILQKLIGMFEREGKEIVKRKDKSWHLIKIYQGHFGGFRGS